LGNVGKDLEVRYAAGGTPPLARAHTALGFRSGQGDSRYPAYEDVKTTHKSYIKTVPSVVTEAMKRLEEKIGSAQMCSRFRSTDV
jgi:hypothetical protein